MRTKRKSVLLLSIASGVTVAVPGCGGTVADPTNTHSNIEGTGGEGEAGATGMGGALPQGTVAVPPGAGGVGLMPLPPGAGGTTFMGVMPLPPGTGGAFPPGLIALPPQDGGTFPCGGHVCGVVVQPPDGGVSVSDAAATVDGASSGGPCNGGPCGVVVRPPDGGADAATPLPQGLVPYHPQ